MHGLSLAVKSRAYSLVAVHGLLTMTRLLQQSPGPGVLSLQQLWRVGSAVATHGL